MKQLLLLITVCIFSFSALAQNSMVGDGFGGRSWYRPHNYQVGAYSAFTVCDTNNQLYGWGHNVYGEFGNGTTISSDTPIAALGMTHVKFYTTGYVSAAIKSDNTAWVWGLGDVSDLIYSGFTSTPVPVLNDVKFVDAGFDHVVFVKNDGTVWGVGSNAAGQLGNGTSSTTLVTTPVQMSGVTNAVRAVALGVTSASSIGAGGATAVLLSDGTVKLTGGYGWFTSVNSNVPITVPGLSGIVDIKGCHSAAYALNAVGEVYAFGKEYSGFPSLGVGAYTGAITPPTKLVFPAGAAPIIALSANNDGHTCLALDENGNVYGWGFNVYGQLGDGTTVNRNIPKLVASNVIDIYAGETFCYILKADSTLRAAGSSSGGSIWMNLTSTQRSSWTQIKPTLPPMNLCAPKIMGVVDSTPVVTAGFTTPDTVCVNTPFNITNTSTGATNYY